MNCDTARLQIGPDLGPRPHMDVTDAALNHLASCHSCRKFYAAQTALVRRLTRLASTPAPAPLRAKIIAAMDSRLRARHRWKLGAALTAAAVVMLLATPRFANERAFDPLADVARSQLAETTMLETGEISEAEEWLAREIGYAVVVPDIEDAVLIGARVSDVGDQKSAVAVYLSRGMPVTYFALPSGEVMGQRVRDRGVVARSSDGYTVAVWTEHGQTRALAAPLGRSQLIKMAEECRSKAVTDNTFPSVGRSNQHLVTGNLHLEYPELLVSRKFEHFTGANIELGTVQAALNHIIVDHVSFAHRKIGVRAAVLASEDL